MFDEPEGIGLLFTTRHGGVSTHPYNSWNLGSVDNSIEDIHRNFEILALASAPKIAISSQVHGAQVVHVDQEYPVFPGREGSLPEADALVTTRTDVALGIRVADCVPVLLADPVAGVIGAAHAGRQGLLAGVLQETLAAVRALGASEIQAWIGPHICAACYEVPADMAQQAWEQIPETKARSRHGTPAIDLGSGAAAILSRQAVQVKRTGDCTQCDSRYFSYRRDHGKTGRQAGVIWRK